MAAAGGTETPRCWGCGRAGLEAFYTVRDVPVHSCLLLDDREAALGYPRGDVVLGFCHGCGLIQNTAFDPDALDYSFDYEDSQAHSPRFVDFATELVRHLVDRYDLHGGKAVEVGCGKGDFSVLLANVGRMRAVGFDPAYRPGPLTPDRPEKVRFVRDLYSRANAEPDADFLCCRHTLEHVVEPREFISMVRHSLGESSKAIIFFEVPDAERIFEEDAFWDIYYEHCSYFTAGSLTRLFVAGGCEVLDLRLGYGGQYLLLEARLGPGDGDAETAAERDDRVPYDVAALARRVERFRRRVPGRIATLRAQVDDLVAGGHRIAVWGASSKAVGYLTTLAFGEEVDCVVDINPAKHGRFMAGTGHEIVAPTDLPERKIDTIILMNSIYRDEVARDLHEMGLAAELFTL